MGSPVTFKNVRHAALVLLRNRWLQYIFLIFIGSLILLWRYPNNVTHPNFYGEDGSVYLQHVVNLGWAKALLQPFNGYFIFGLYAIEAIGWIVNAIFGHAGLISLPQYFALTSIFFMAAAIALPYLLFRRRYGSGKMLVVVLFGMLLPLPLSPHIVIGTVGNQKWIFLYIAFLLTLYWIQNRRTLRWSKLALLVLGLFICAYTNATTYLLVPVLFIPYMVDTVRNIQKRRVRSWLSTLIRTRDFQALIILGIILIPQIIYVYLHGIPKLPGYLDTPYKSNTTIELFINRTYLFGVTHILNRYLNDLIAIGLFVIMLGLGFWALKKEGLKVFLFSLYTAGGATLLFTINRPGVTAFFNGYDRSGSGPDQFFYAQTLVMYLAIVLIAFAVRAKLKRYHIGDGLLALFILFIIGSGLASNAIFGATWRNASVYENDAGTFIDQSLASCTRQHGKAVRVVVYPYASGQFSLTVPRGLICNQSLSRYQPSVESLDLVAKGNFRTITRGTRVTQTFVATEPKLNGIRVFMSDFGNDRRSGSYKLVVYNGSCKEELRSVILPSTTIDNWWYNARFSPISESAGRTYCFTVVPPISGSYSPIALQLSAPNVYSAGQLSINGEPQDNDTVFTPLFVQVK